MWSWVLLFCAIVSEVGGTTALKASDGFTKLLPSIGVAVGYGIAFVLLSIAVRSIPLGTAYAVWSGVGTVGAMLIGIFLFHEKATIAQMFGVFLILVGTVILKISTQE